MAEFQDTGPVDTDTKLPIKIPCLVRASGQAPLECDHYSCWAQYTRAVVMARRTYLSHVTPPQRNPTTPPTASVGESHLPAQVKTDGSEHQTSTRKWIEPDRIEDAIAILKVAVADGSITKQALFERFSEQSLETVRETLRCLP